jgi:hypothetical protein
VPSTALPIYSIYTYITRIVDQLSYLVYNNPPLGSSRAAGSLLRVMCLKAYGWDKNPPKLSELLKVAGNLLRYRTNSIYTLIFMRTDRVKI